MVVKCSDGSRAGVERGVGEDDRGESKLYRGAI
jgi:hypothetical protein